MISLITAQAEDKRHYLYYIVRAINLDTERLKNSIWKLNTLIELFRHKGLLLYFLIGEKEQLHLKLLDNMKVQTLTESDIVKTSFTSVLMIADWKKVTTETITIKFL